VLQEQLLAEIKRMGAQIYTTSAAEASYLSDDPTTCLASSSGRSLGRLTSTSAT
jgi:hypothetical protein